MDAYFIKKFSLHSNKKHFIAIEMTMLNKIIVFEFTCAS